MSPQHELIRSIRKAITELKKRRMNPNTAPVERSQLTALLAELDAQLAPLTAQRIAQAAVETALSGPDGEMFRSLTAAARELDDAIARKKQTSAIVALVSTAFVALERS
jgi:hypothetical protein